MTAATFCENAGVVTVRKDSGLWFVTHYFWETCGGSNPVAIELLRTARAEISRGAHQVGIAHTLNQGRRYPRDTRIAVDKKITQHLARFIEGIAADATIDPGALGLPETLAEISGRIQLACDARG